MDFAKSGCAALTRTPLPKHPREPVPSQGLAPGGDGHLPAASTSALPDRPTPAACEEGAREVMVFPAAFLCVSPPSLPHSPQELLPLHVVELGGTHRPGLLPSATRGIACLIPGCGTSQLKVAKSRQGPARGVLPHVRIFISRNRPQIVPCPQLHLNSLELKEALLFPNGFGEDTD